MKSYLLLLCFLPLWFMLSCENQQGGSLARSDSTLITHGPMLGHVTHNSIRIWARTSKPGAFQVQYWETQSTDDTKNGIHLAETSLKNDNASWIALSGLRPDTKYAYKVIAEGNEREGTFRTLPDGAT
ncbi:MAG: fibronectin type III domain-containing protein, partial [Bacteroidota bacterium]